MLEAPLFMDLSEMEQYIPLGVYLHVKLHPTIERFSLISGVTTEFYQIDINYLSLRCKFIEPTAAVSVLHAKILEMWPSLFSKVFTVPKGVQTWSLNSLYSEHLPYEILVVFIDSRGYNGETKYNCFNFEHFDLTHMGGFLIQGMNGITFEPDFSNHQFTNEFLVLYESNQIGGLITYKDFDRGYSIFLI